MSQKKFNKKTLSKLEPKLLAQESSFFLYFFVLTSFKKIFFFIFSLLGILMNLVYLSLIQVYESLGILQTRFLISNDDLTTSFFT